MKHNDRYEVTISDEDYFRLFPKHLDYEECEGVFKDDFGHFKINFYEVVKLLGTGGFEGATSENEIIDLAAQFYNTEFEAMINTFCDIIRKHRKRLQAMIEEYDNSFSKFSNMTDINKKSEIKYVFEVDSNKSNEFLNKFEALQDSFEEELDEMSPATYKFKGIEIFKMKVKHDDKIIFDIVKL